MSQFVGRFVILSTILSLVLLLLGYLVIQQPGVRLSKFEHTQTTRFASIKPESPPLDKIVVTPCAEGPCLLVQAGGRDFVVGAGANSAAGLLNHGLLSERIDGVILTELGSEQIEGLIGLRDRSLEVGRQERLNVYGPSGIETIVEGMNAMLETSDVERSVRFGQGVLPFDIAPAQAIVVDETPGETLFFDSGVLQVHAFPVANTLSGAEAIYRFDYEGQSLIVGGCGVRLQDVNEALVGSAEKVMLVIPAASPEQLEIIRSRAQASGLIRESRFAYSPVDKCLSAKGAALLQKEAGIMKTLLSPLYPAPLALSETKLWNSAVSDLKETQGIDMRPGIVWQQIYVKEE